MNLAALVLVNDWAFPSSRFWTCCWHQIQGKPILYLQKCIQLMSYNIIYVVSICKKKTIILSQSVYSCFYTVSQHFWNQGFGSVFGLHQLLREVFCFFCAKLGDGLDKINCTGSLLKRFHKKKHWWDDESGVVLRNWCCICTDSGRWKTAWETQTCIVILL